MKKSMVFIFFISNVTKPFKVNSTFVPLGCYPFMPLIEVSHLAKNFGSFNAVKDVSFHVNEGDVFGFLGPNGAGKSTLANVLAGREDYEITAGEVIFDGQDLLELATEDRARAGLFLAFQYPVEIPGVSNVNFLRTALNEKRAYLGQEPISAKEFIEWASLSLNFSRSFLVSMVDSPLIKE